MKGYKAFNKGYICHGFQYEIGQTYELEGEIKICKNGFHFCKNLIDVFGYYPYDKNEICLAEVEAIGDIVQAGTKYCTNKIKIIRAVGWEEVEKNIKNCYCNTGSYNTGSYNTGSYNSGWRNSGAYNSGSYNSGPYNSGDYNTGHYNTGDRNSGSDNTGSYNTGSYNSGWRNSGVYNSGSYNTGSYNSGNHNTGYYNNGWYNTGDHNNGSYNSGSYNSGSYNSGWYNSDNRNSGFFNSEEPTIRLFNKNSNMTFDEFFTLGINLFNLEDSKSIIQNLPNYDAEVFYKTTGIDWR